MSRRVAVARPPVEVDAALLRGWPILPPSPRADKEERGSALVIAGSRELGGAAILAAEAALRAGAGKLVVATAQSVAPALVPALPEARVVGLPETKAGGLAGRALANIEPLLEAADAVLIGPGFADERSTLAFVRAVLKLPFAAPVVLDALAIGVVAGIGRLDRPVLITPHAGEMAHLTGLDKEAIGAEPESVARAVAKAANIVVALKGAVTHVADGEGRCWRHRRAVPGLATSGSGDVLAGLVAGLIARGAEPAQAAVWGVALHARAGEATARRHGATGSLARELAAEVPALLARLQNRARAAPARRGLSRR